jgi:site-specific DNA-methyltransferase (adenine-specific)
MSADYLQVNQPDILEVIANLSNDAVFTPPKVVHAVLDLLPTDVWSDPTLRWLDPGAKTGIFPREITKRLMVGLAEAFPDEAKRLDHILSEMVFAIATEEITGMMTRRSLYCSKDAAGEFSVAHFATSDGNVWQKRVKHSFDASGRCSECKGNQEQLLQPGRDNKAYGFIHADGRKQIEKEMDMKFDVIVGNPPYQMDADGGNRTMPIYNIFVDEAKKLDPRYLSFIIPSRWMAGGLGLNDFRNEMLADKRIRKISDFAKMGPRQPRCVRSDVHPGRRRDWSRQSTTRSVRHLRQRLESTSHTSKGPEPQEPKTFRSPFGSHSVWRYLELRWIPPDQTEGRRSVPRN